MTTEAVPRARPGHLAARPPRMPHGDIHHHGAPPARGLLAAIDQEELMRVAKLMHRDVATCRTIDTLARAAQLMWDRDIGCLPVVDEGGHVAGMITDRDVCMAAYTRGVPLTAIPVTLAMSRTVHACLPTDELSTAEHVMTQHQVRRLPVIDDQGNLVGLISLTDVARAASKTGVTATEVATTLAGICAPRELVATA